MSDQQFRDGDREEFHNLVRFLRDKCLVLREHPAVTEDDHRILTDMEQEADKILDE